MVIRTAGPRGHRSATQYINAMSNRAKAGEKTAGNRPTPDADRICRAVDALPAGRYLLAVSGGRDSMVMLDAFTARRHDVVGVATFDHASGAAATRAARLVEREVARRSVPFIAGRGHEGEAGTEAAWRDARWSFLRRWAVELSATVVTAHTRDDQIETVVIRILRDAGARGLAGMYAESDIARPLLDITRAEISSYAQLHELRFVDDPSNDSFAHLRNRVRHQLLPALERSRPGFSGELLDIARRAADWRIGIDALVDGLGVTPLLSEQGTDGTGVVVPASAFTLLDASGAAMLWPAIAARARIALDWRGTERLAAFTATGTPGGRIPLSGGAEVQRTASSFVLRNCGAVAKLYS